MRNYETVFILNPVLSDEQTKEAVSKFTAHLKSNGAEIVIVSYTIYEKTRLTGYNVHQGPMWQSSRVQIVQGRFCYLLSELI